MEYRYLGNSGLKISEITYGNWLTHGSQVENDVATQCVRAALDAGISTFDTADVYANTVAEDVLGYRVGVDVSRVERADTRVQCRADALGRHVVLHLGTVGEPVTVGDLRDLQTAVAQVSVFHDCLFLSTKIVIWYVRQSIPVVLNPRSSLLCSAGATSSDGNRWVSLDKPWVKSSRVLYEVGGVVEEQ